MCLPHSRLRPYHASRSRKTRADLPEVKSIRLGFGNHYKLGCWTPVYVELSGALGDSGAPGRFDIEAPDGDDVPAWFIGPRSSGREGATRTEYVRIGRPNSQLKYAFDEIGLCRRIAAGIAAVRFHADRCRGACRRRMS